VPAHCRAQPVPRALAEGGVPITPEDIRQAGEPDRETLRRRAAHAGPIDEDTLVYRIEFHAVGPGD
jgi:hypothetical protein